MFNSPETYEEAIELAELHYKASKRMVNAMRERFDKDPSDVNKKLLAAATEVFQFSHSNLRDLRLSKNHAV